MIVARINELLGEQIYDESPRLEASLLKEIESSGVVLNQKPKRVWLRGVLYLVTLSEEGEVVLEDTYVLDDKKFSIAFHLGDNRIVKLWFSRVSPDWYFGKTKYVNKVPLLSMTMLDVVDKEMVKNARAVLHEEDLLENEMFQKFFRKYQKVLGKELSKVNYEKLMQDVEILKKRLSYLELDVTDNYDKLYKWFSKEVNI